VQDAQHKSLGGSPKRKRASKNSNGKYKKLITPRKKPDHDFKLGNHVIL